MKYGFLNIIFSMAINLSVSAEIIFDATLGSPIELEGPSYQITPTMGQSQGNNLFHSFNQFNLNQGESATFTGPQSIKNVISRVTGGQTSHIDGVLRSTIPHADMYFLNPAGIIFGPHAKIDIPNSLYISSADYLKLGENGRFDATLVDNTVLTVAPPSAFGFLNHNPAHIIIDGSQLILPNQTQLTRFIQTEDVPIHTLSLVGGNITIKEGSLIGFGNDIHLMSVASQGEAPLDPVKLRADTFTAYGILKVMHSNNANRLFGNIDTSGFGGGTIFIRAGQLILDKGWIFADTFGHLAGRGITIQTTDRLELNNSSRITAEVYDNEQFFSKAIGHAGHIAIKADDIYLGSGSQIASSTQSIGNAGHIQLTANRTLLITGADQSGLIPISSGVLSNTRGSGDGGNIMISADQIIMNAEAQINTNTETGHGNAGHLSLQVRRLEMSGGARIHVGVGHRLNPTGSGKGGNLAIEATEAVQINGTSAQQPSGLSSNTFSSQGHGGQIMVSAPVINLEHGGNIETTTLRNGIAGHMTLNTNTLNLLAGGRIQTNTITGHAPGGHIEITAHNIINITGIESGISAVTEQKASGQGGEVKITAHYLQVTDGGAITVSSQGQGQAGNISLNVGDQVHMRNASIRTSTRFADGGNIQMTTPSYLYLTNSEITTSVKAKQGNGGNITLQPKFIVLDKSQIRADAFQGQGGNINMMTTGIYNFSGEPIQEIITASSKLGIDGEVVITSPDRDVSEGLVILPSVFVDATNLLKRNCQIQDINQLSTFSYRAQREGMPRTPQDFQE